MNMLLSIFIKCCAFSLLMSITSAPWANGNWPAITGARNAAMGGAGVAYATDPTGLTLNPALGSTLGEQLTVTPILVLPDYNANGTKSQLAIPKLGNIVRDLPGIVLGCNHHFSPKITVGVTLVGNSGSTQFERSPILPNSLSPNKAIGGAALLNFPIAYSVNHSFSIGVMPTIGYLSLRTDASLQSPWEPNANTLGIGARFGAQYDLNRSLSFAGSVTTPTRFEKLSEYSDVIKNHIQLPTVLLVGSVFHAPTRTDILFDFEEVLWASTSSAGGGARTAGGDSWVNAYDFKIGLQQQIDDRFMLRGGYQYSQRVIPSNDIYPNNVFNSPDNLLRHLVMAGVGCQATKTFSFDFTVVYGLPVTLIDDGQGPAGLNAAGYTINGSVKGILLGLNWAFDKK